MAYYIASNTEVPLLPWDKTTPGLFVQAIQPDVDGSVVKHFSKTFIRYVGSHEGCGCGFRHGKDWFENEDEDQDEEELKDTEARQKDHEQLRDYLVEYCAD